LIDLKGPMFVPLLAEHKAQLYSHLVFAANGSCVDTTIIDGKLVMEGRKMTTIDEELVCRKANEAFTTVLGRMVVPDRPTP